MFDEIKLLTIAIVLLCVVVCFVSPDTYGKEIISMCITGLFGIVTGRVTARP
mgnify:CR=1 FL=1|jgi:hypothetical protein